MVSEHSSDSLYLNYLAPFPWLILFAFFFVYTICTFKTHENLAQGWPQGSISSLNMNYLIGWFKKHTYINMEIKI
jgi:hypothetical protein